MAYDRKKHHYVSQLYFRNFAFNEEETHVHPMTKKGFLPCEPNKIAHICYEKNYNTKLQEDEQGRLENEYAKILRDFIASPNPDDLNLSRDFIEFVSFMFANNIDTRKTIAEELSKLKLKIEGFPDDHSVSIDNEHRGRFDLSQAFADAVFEEFQSWKFVRRQTNGYKVFITSDNPVSLFPKHFTAWSLLEIARQLPTELQKQDSRRKSIRLSLAISLRSDIFYRIRRVAREPDKMPYSLLRWDDTELLCSVIEERFISSFEIPPEVLSDNIYIS